MAERIVEGVRVGQNNHLTVGFFGEENTVVGIQLTYGAGEYAEAVFKLLNEIHSALVLVDFLQVPDQI